MLNLISQFFNTLLGVALPESVVLILSFALVSTLFGAFFSILGLKNDKVWKFATYVSIGIMAIMAIADVANFNLAFGGA